MIRKHKAATEEIVDGGVEHGDEGDEGGEDDLKGEDFVHLRKERISYTLKRKGKNKLGKSKRNHNLPYCRRPPCFSLKPEKT